MNTQEKRSESQVAQRWIAKAAEVYNEATGKTICVFPGVRCDEPAPEHANLIAAAPLLLEALSELVPIVEAEYADDPEPEDLPSWKAAIEVAQRALEAATQGQP